MGSCSLPQQLAQWFWLTIGSHRLYFWRYVSFSPMNYSHTLLCSRPRVPVLYQLFLRQNMSGHLRVEEWSCNGENSRV